ncbi:hypothetical protein KSP39_PZI003389 [Platanthera zijinensis]|uniref:DNA-directed DNA polymerase n=1 Tax=Platanthera zijinensis TaxID=2320716 RepID=A0AAP0BUJ2_9ASPA
MYPYLSRDDCYYTDTDSVVLGKPLDNEMIDSDLDSINVLKYKGPAKSMVNPEWIELQFKDHLVSLS